MVAYPPNAEHRAKCLECQQEKAKLLANRHRRVPESILQKAAGLLYLTIPQHAAKSCRNLFTEQCMLIHQMPPGYGVPCQKSMAEFGAAHLIVKGTSRRGCRICHEFKTGPLTGHVDGVLGTSTYCSVLADGPTTHRRIGQCATQPYSESHRLTLPADGMKQTLGCAVQHGHAARH